MLDKLYKQIKERFRFVQNLHNWLAGKIDDVLATIIKEKLSDLSTFVYKLTDRFLLYVFSVAAIVLIYSVLFYVTKFMWLGYTETYVGNVLVNSNGYALASRIYDDNNVYSLFALTSYCAFFSLALFTATRMFFLNRFFYEGWPGFLTSVIWGVPLAKVSSLLYADSPSTLMPLVDAKFVLFLLPSTLLLHATMQFVNWLVPEIDDLIKNPITFWRKLNVEREFQRARSRHGGE